ncbi:MAG: sigma-70 family RNA polymerase sigma factor [Gemmatimonadaceae bacterium]|nr:sigma-70 family RNA polymerase sigma factor [Gemmatimonadaceae bacterium]MCW5826570.1 sigma-70 family RNA polymerase sigma factor [Gemmatimonadaceae bacterium]
MGHSSAPATPDDVALIEGCRRGEPSAQRALFDRYRDRVHAIALHYLKGDGAAAQDATQEVFVRFFNAASGFRAESRVSTYLYRAVANACIDELRRRRRFVFVGDLPEALHPVDESSPATEAGDPALHRAVHALSPKLRMVVLMRYYDDLSYDEIGAALGVSAGTVASRLNRAHEAIGRRLGGDTRVGATGAPDAA